MKRTLFVTLMAVVALLLPLGMAAQEKKDAAETTVTGCFNKADMEGYFVITEEKTSKKLTVAGDPAMLARHANNHKVTLTGSMAKEKDKDVFKATKLQMLSLCQ